ncbi:hypothetical protein D9M68_461130 [compost metagenome]
MHDLHTLDIDAEHFVGNLRQRGFQALAMRMRADAQFQGPVGGQSGGGLLVAGDHRDAPPGIDRGAMRGLLTIDRDAHPDQPSVGFAPALARAHRRYVNGFDRQAKRPRIVTAVKVLVGNVVERHLLWPYQTLQPDLVGFDARFARDRIEHQLEGKANAGSRHTAIWQDRALVSGDGKRLAAIGRKIVRAGQDAGDLRRLETGREWVG